MTTVPPAEPRPPPPPRPPDLQRSRTYSAFDLDNVAAGTPSDTSLSRPAEAQHADDRPLKRRKTDHAFGAEASVDQQIAGTGEVSRSQLKTKLIGDLRLLSSVLAGQTKDDTQSQEAEPPPLPTRPWRNARPVASTEESKPTHRARALLEVPTTPDTLEDVMSAPSLGNKAAGSFPWLGRHPEDVLSEANVKQGYFDRPLNPPDRELSSARVPLHSALKHKSGIEILSTLFSLILEAKNKHGIIGSTSSFKPPPRVTLAEAKRRAWIADLADANVPLRKLSRTIPQGIRGQSLLDQCIQNAVPLSRAIWFAKCVGANEIRTLKRKGTTAAAAVGTESKWLREWTMNVEQFVEAILLQCGQLNWRSNIQYALRFTTRLYLENLVDRDRYVDWIVKSFTASDDDRLPFWLMVVHIHKHDIAKFRGPAKKLVEILVYRYMALKDSTLEVVQSLVTKLRNAIRGFALNRPECFIMPDSWPSIREGLESCLNEGNPQENQILDRLEHANERCMGANRQEYLTRLDPADVIIDVLDSSHPPYDPTVLSSKLFSACSDLDALISSCLEWATTKFRCRGSRVYLVVRLLRQWYRQGKDIGSALLDFVTRLHTSPGHFDYDALSHLVAELSRSHTFPLSKYLQWLNVRGLPRPDTFSNIMDVEGIVTQRCSDIGGLSTHLPLLDVKAHLANQRNTLLARAGFDADAESLAVSRIRELLEQILNCASEDPGPDLAKILSGLNWNIRLQISHWIRTFVSEKVKQRHSTESKYPMQDTQPISMRQFGLLRSSLEIIGDEAGLADILRLCSSLNDEPIQASIVETITRHADAFSAIGALETLRTRLCQMYMSLRSIKPTMPLFANALLDLYTVYPIKSTPVRLLQQDLVRGDRGRAVAAFSPFSDGLAESLQQAEATFIEDFEAVLQSEPSMNEQTMARLFAVLVERIGKLNQGIDNQIVFTYCQLMARLRLFRKQQGDDLMKMWLSKVLSKGFSSFVQVLVFNLIGVGALTVDILAETIIESGKINETLTRLLPGDPTRNHESHYAVLSKWEDFGRRQPADMLNLLSRIAAPFREAFDERQLCTCLVLRQRDALPRLSQEAVQLLERVLNELVADENSEPDFKHMLQPLSTTSLAFIQLRMQLLACKPAPEEKDIVAESIKDIVFDCTNQGTSGRHVSMLLQAAGSEVTMQVRQLAEEYVLEILPKLTSSSPSESESLGMEDVQDAIDQAFKLCHGATAPWTKSTGQLIDKLSHLLKFLGHVNPPPSPTKATATSPTSAPTPQLPSISSQQLNPSSPMDTGPPCALPPSTIDYFRVLLQILCLIRPAPFRINNTTTRVSQPQPPLAPKSQSDQIKILILLASLSMQDFLTSPSNIFPNLPSAISAAAESQSFCYDVMATYVDDLSDEGRALCAKVLKGKIKDDKAGKLRWLFGSVNLCGSEMPGVGEMGKGLLVKRKGEVKGEWKPRVWEVLESGGRGGDGEVSLGLGLFGARR